MREVEMEQIAAHLRRCAECDEFGGEYAALVAALEGRLASPTVTADVRARLGERMGALWREEHG